VIVAVSSLLLKATVIAVCTVSHLSCPGSTLHGRSASLALKGRGLAPAPAHKTRQISALSTAGTELLGQHPDLGCCPPRVPQIPAVLGAQQPAPRLGCPAASPAIGLPSSQPRDWAAQQPAP